MAEKKMSIFALLEILKEYSDENHILSSSEMIRLLEQKYNISIDRRTLYTNIEMLQNFDYDISTYTDNGKGYYLIERQIEEAEVILLCNAIHASNFIPKRHSRDLIKKLLSTQSKYIAKNFNEAVNVENFNKKENKDFFMSLQVALEAIQEGCCISFAYLRYNHEKELVSRRNDEYSLHPYYLIYNREKVYLIGKTEKYDDFSHYRLDRIKNMHKLDKKVKTLAKHENPYDYARSKIYMYGGKEMMFTLKCHNNILDDIIDLFGKGISIQKSGEEHFVTMIRSSKQGLIYLTLQYLEYMEILEPLSVRREILEILRRNIDKYQ